MNSKAKISAQVYQNSNMLCGYRMHCFCFEKLFNKGEDGHIYSELGVMWGSCLSVSLTWEKYNWLRGGATASTQMSESSGIIHSKNPNSTYQVIRNRKKF